MTLKTCSNVAVLEDYGDVLQISFEDKHNKPIIGFCYSNQLSRDFSDMPIHHKRHERPSCL